MCANSSRRHTRRSLVGIEWHINLGFDRLKEHVSEVIDQALIEGAEQLHAAVTPLVPVETGNLVGSGDVGLGPAPGDGVQGDHVSHLYYPGPYALYQHEGVYFRRPATYGNPLSHEHGESFFLIRPTVSEGPAIIQHMGDVIRGAL